MIGYQYHDGGRLSAGYKGNDAGDCVVRALAIATGGDYRELYREMARANKDVSGKRSARNGVGIKAYGPVYERHGFVKVKLPRGAKPTYTEAYETYGDCIVHTTRHICAIVGGKLRDTFDGRTYQWSESFGERDWITETRERKAQSIWVRKEKAPPVVVELSEETLERLEERFPGCSPNDAIVRMLDGRIK